MTQDGSGKCPVTFGLDLFGDRWSLLIVRDIVFRGKQRYSEFARSYEKIATNILATRLANMEDAGILASDPDPAHSARKLYRLTEKGCDLIPTLLEIIRWSAVHDPGNHGRSDLIAGAAPDLLDRIRNDRDALIADLRCACLNRGKP